MPINKRSDLVLSYVEFAQHLIQVNSLLDVFNVKESMSAVCKNLELLKEARAEKNILFLQLAKNMKNFYSTLQYRSNIDSTLGKAIAIALHNTLIMDIICGEKIEQDVFSNDDLLFVYEQLDVKLDRNETIDMFFDSIGSEADNIINDAFKVLDNFNAELEIFRQMDSNDITLSQQLVERLITIHSYCQTQIILQSNVLELSEDYKKAITVINDLITVSYEENGVNQTLLDNIAVAKTYYDAAFMARKNFDNLTSLLENDLLLKIVLENPELASVFLQSDDKEKLLDNVQAKSLNDFISNINSLKILIESSVEESFSSSLVPSELSQLSDLANELDTNNLEYYIYLASLDEENIKDTEYLHDTVTPYSKKENLSLLSQAAESDDLASEFDSHSLDNSIRVMSVDDDSIKYEELLDERENTQKFSVEKSNNYSIVRFFNTFDDKNSKSEKIGFYQSEKHKSCSLNANHVTGILMSVLTTASIAGSVSLGFISAPFAFATLLIVVGVFVSAVPLAINLCNKSDAPTAYLP